VVALSEECRLITLEPAIDGRAPWEIVGQIDHGDPLPMKRLNPAVPRDLVTIVAKAMAKDAFRNDFAAVAG
jgi:eukaryotic-like serine/threonine-protein kinase